MLEVGVSYLIPVSGASIRSPEVLWDRVLSWMEAPSEVVIKTATTMGAELTGKASGRIGIPFVAQGQAEASGKGSAARTWETSEKSTRGGIDHVVREIGDSSFTVFIDDFHYMPP